MVDRIGQDIGDYRLLILLGGGSFGEVYLGEHRHDQSRAAIKVLKTHLTTHELKQFVNEARIIRLRHPHIIPLLDFGVGRDDIPYLVMDYAPGGTLRQRHPKGTHVPLALIITYIQQLAGALQYAHEQRVIHRDVKPENVLFGLNDLILLSDFGLALVLQTTDLQSLPRMGGTLPYMAPEQLQGTPRPASDQYALGIMTYEWLCGERPFQGSLAEITTGHLFKPPPSPADKGAIVTPAVEQVVLKALAKNPKQRFERVQDFADALKQAAQEEAQTHPSAASQQTGLFLDNMPQSRLSTVSSQDLSRLAQQEQTTPLPIVSETPVFLPIAEETPSDKSLKDGERVAYLNQLALQTFRTDEVSFAASLPIAPLLPPTGRHTGQEQIIAYPPRQRTLVHRGSKTPGIVLITFIGLLFFLLIGVSLFTLNNHQSGNNIPASVQAGGSQQSSDATATAQVIAQAVASQQAADATVTAQVIASKRAVYATVTAVTSHTPLLTDNLRSDSNGSWSNDGQACAFQNGTYHVLVNQANFLQPCRNTTFTMNNGAIKANLSLVRGSDAGIIYSQSNDQFYDFEITSQGTFFFRRHDANGGGNYISLISETNTPAIASGSATNTLLMIVSNGDFTLFINGVFVAKAKDSTYNTGEIGFVAGTLPPATSADASFSNLTVYPIV